MRYRKCINLICCEFKNTHSVIYWGILRKSAQHERNTVRQQESKQADADCILMQIPHLFMADLLIHIKDLADETQASILAPHDGIA